MGLFSSKQIYHLSIEIDGSDDEIETLKEYAKIKDSIKREILVQPEMPLRCLHYVIQQLFGWQNKKEHFFMYSFGIYRKFKHSKINHDKLCGIYFKVPTIEEKEEVKLESLEDYKDYYKVLPDFS